MHRQPLSISQAPYCYRADFLNSDAADTLFEQLLVQVEWREEVLKMFGRSVKVPRLIACFGEPAVSYRYSGVEHPAVPWPQYLADVADVLAMHLDARPNFVLLNRYRDGTDYMGWHADDEKMIGDNIASISLGATRRFLLRPDRQKPSLKLDLEHGSLLIMNRFLYHSLPRAKTVHRERINLTFRII